MKCFCKYCSSQLICQRKHPTDLCYYRYAIDQNITDDYGCVENDGSKFFVSLFNRFKKKYKTTTMKNFSSQCDTTDLFYRTECCVESLCNVRQRSVTKKSFDYSFVVAVVVSLVIISLILFILYFRRKFVTRLSTFDSSIKTKCSPLDDF